MSSTKISLKSNELDPQKAIHNKLVVPPRPRRSSRIFHHPERFMDIEEAFLMGNRGHGDDPSTFDKAMFDIDFEKWLMQ